jgi:uncharacterized membrane protein YgcG
VYNTVGPHFEQLAADILGDHGTEKDGFDTLFTPAALSLPEEEVNLAAFTPDLLDAGFTAGEFEGSNLLPIAKDTADFTGAGDPLAQDIGNSTTVTQPPGSSGSGTGGGGGGGSGGGGGQAGGGGGPGRRE